MSTWLITGASSGLGRALAEHVLGAGRHVVATARDPKVLDDLRTAFPETALIVPVDVTDSASIQAAVDGFSRSCGSHAD
ncbi:SDR family NAD(P)-dependent oxidoreductase [Curtobacterium sp. PhB115]|uniref:SDR family NAD(P)-dependent oxidoreductase n=1 Tax=Curtobacterium sp. PhB115 TaxID=2485173 RepID=UPI000F4BBAA3|nr:SDR family NAD(P)-dependent oxidoreductase [Curtobacterium sp. PhB115]ROP72604.1 short subunit dehydrogenase [Curtobacterium sp. PhB115]